MTKTRRTNVRSARKRFVTILCNGKVELMTRTAAIAKFREGVGCCEGSERDRYMNILLDLMDGKRICKDIH